MIDLDELERKAKACTDQDFDSAQWKTSGNLIDCPLCNGDGQVEIENDYCNYDSTAIGVQFYGIGKEFGAAEQYYRSANPATILELIRRLRDAEKDAERYRWLREREDQLSNIGCWLESDGLPIECGWLCGANLDSAIDAAMNHEERGSK